MQHLHFYVPMYRTITFRFVIFFGRRIKESRLASCRMEERIHCCRVHWVDAEDGERETEREREHVERDVTVRPRRDAGGQTDRRPVVVWCEQSDREGTPRSFCYNIYYHVRGCILTPSCRWVWKKPLSIRVNNNRNVRPCVFVRVINSIFYSTMLFILY